MLFGYSFSNTSNVGFDYRDEYMLFPQSWCAINYVMGQKIYKLYPQFALLLLWKV